MLAGRFHRLATYLASCGPEARKRLMPVQTGRSSRASPASMPSTRLFFTVHGFTSDTAPVAAGRRNIFRRARGDAARSKAAQLRCAMFGKGL
jgi:hypothetical protein